MTEAQGAVGLDRLPWLPDEPPTRSRSASVLPWLIAAIALVVAVGYWLGVKASQRDAEPAAHSPAQPSETIALPQPRLAVPQQRVEPVEPVVAPPIPIVGAPAREHPVRRAPVERVRQKPAARPVSHTAPEKVAAPTNKPSASHADAVPPIWPVRQIEGASGRLVRVGAFASVHQAKRGWWAIMKVNPALKRLPALVVPVQSQRNGKVYYRLQMGTTSQAHSAVLCQRMRMIAQSCVVIGLDGANGQVAL